MTLPTKATAPTEVGVRELHDHLSRYVKDAQSGREVIVTMRGKRVARLTAIDHIDTDPIEELVARGIIKRPKTPFRSADFPPPIEMEGSLSDVVIELRD